VQPFSAIKAMSLCIYEENGLEAFRQLLEKNCKTLKTLEIYYEVYSSVNGLTGFPDLPKLEKLSISIFGGKFYKDLFIEININCLFLKSLRKNIGCHWDSKIIQRMY
jgi:hypothetical protein